MKKKIGGATLPGGRVSRQSQRVRGVDATFSVFRKQKIPHFEKYLHAMMLKLTEQVGITILFCISKKPGEILIFRTFIAKF